MQQRWLRKHKHTCVFLAFVLKLCQSPPTHTCDTVCLTVFSTALTNAGTQLRTGRQLLLHNSALDIHSYGSHKHQQAGPLTPSGAGVLAGVQKRGMLRQPENPTKWYLYFQLNTDIWITISFWHFYPLKRFSVWWCCSSSQKNWTGTRLPWIPNAASLSVF